MFRFFSCFWSLAAAGDSDRLRLFVGAAADSEEEESEVEDRLVFAVDGFWVDVAWRVSLESLGVCVTFGLEFEIFGDFVGFGGMEKSISSDSLLSEELVPDDEDVSFAAVGTATGAGDF